MAKTVRITIRLPEDDVRIMDQFVESGEFSNRSDFIRKAIREHSRKTMPEVRKALEEEQAYRKQLLELEQLRSQMDEMKRVVDQLAKK